ncbi:MAG: ATP-dependent Clp protease adaptor ClpS [Candidatus Brocadiae bacterium]|nr:ATP-dependent Clp protease adaptor ClpS [Candidatus Brocadiia bacterium]
MPGPTLAPRPPAVLPDSETRTRLSPLWRVIIHNDDVTPMDFVVSTLREFWAIGLVQAVRIMLEAHLSGAALVAVETKEQAEFHVDRAHSSARARRYPLTFSLEPGE